MMIGRDDRSAGGSRRRRRPAAARPRCGAFTLVEVATSLVIISLIMVAAGSALVLSSHAVPVGSGSALESLETARAVDRLTTELRHAVAVPAASTTSITFIVPDRDGDLAPEQIIYGWPGTSGAPLYRQYNGGPVVPVLDRVAAFSLAPRLETVSEAVEQPDVVSGETSLISVTSLLSLSHATVDNNNSWAQNFQPTLPGNAVSWTITRVKVNGKKDLGWSGSLRVSLQLPLGAAAEVPGGFALEERSISAGSFGALLDSWVEATFSNVPDLPPDQGICLVFTNDQSANCRLRYRNALVGDTSAWYHDGVSWQHQAGKTFLMQVFGTITADGGTQLVETDYATAVEVVLQPVGDPGGGIDTAAPLLNRPTPP